MKGNKKATKFSMIIAMFTFIILLASFAFASTETLDVRLTEYISEVIAYDQTLGESSVSSDTRMELGENRTGTSRTGHELHDFKIYGEINISNVETTGNSVLNSINITFNGTLNMSNIQLKTAPPGNYLVYNISDLTPEASGLNNVSIYVAELRPGHSVIFEFNITTFGKGEPLNFTENYTSWRMMTGNATEVILNATNSFPTDVLLYDLSVTKTPACYASVDGESCFRFTDLSGEDRFNATIDSSGGSTIIEWNISGRDLQQYETRQIRFNAWAPENLTIFWNESADWATWMNMGNLSATFKFNGSMSGLELINVSAVAPYARVSVSKDRFNETHWNATFNITNDAPAPVDYNLTKVSIWATQYQQYSDPGNTATWVANTNVTAYRFGVLPGTQYANATWFPRINLSAGGYNDSHSILFNYSLVPIVWSSTNFIVLDDGTQIFRLNQSQTLENGYLFIEEIYVLLGGYLVKATKTITPFTTATANNSYIINVTIENVGREKTPEWVSMFDLIPADFHPLIWTNDNWATTKNMTDENEITSTDFDGNWDTLAASNTVLGYADTGAISGGEYDGYWGYHIDFNGLNATSDGNGRFSGAGLADTEVGIRYKIAGNRSISRIENAYIVGVDPIRLEGANPSRSVASRLAATSTTMEYVVLIGSLIVSITILSVGFGFIKKR
jgi:hypothetical protein